MLAARAMQPETHDPAEQPETSGEDAPVLAIERFATMSADIEAGGARDEVLAREGLSLAAWTRAQESWLGKMADEAARKRFELTNRYNAAFVAQRRSLDGSARRAEQKNKKGPIAAPAKVALASPPFVAPPPSFVAPGPAFVAPPAPFGAAPAKVAAPAKIAAPAPIAAPGRIAMPTMELPAFGAIPAPSVVASSPPTHLGGTVAAELISPFVSGAPLPFRTTSIGNAAPAPPAASNLEGLPFRSTAGPAPAPLAPAAVAAPSRAARFTLEQFASLSAEIAVAPAAVAQVRGRYGLEEASHRAEAEEWGRRFAADRELFVRYSALFQSYRDWLTRSGR